jgi:multisubunit Na+/H+ antiporter MnhB subunit
MSGPGPRWERSTLLDVGAELIFHTVLVFAFYLLLAGHNRPGGGFISGLVAGAAFVVRYLASGRLDEHLARLAPQRIVGGGLLLAAGAAGAPLLGDGVLFEKGSATLELAVIGKLKLTTVLLFEIGVAAVVIGLVAAVLAGLGQGSDVDPDAEEAL